MEQPRRLRLGAAQGPARFLSINFQCVDPQIYISAHGHGLPFNRRQLAKGALHMRGHPFRIIARDMRLCRNVWCHDQMFALFQGQGARRVWLIHRFINPANVPVPGKAERAEDQPARRVIIHGMGDGVALAERIQHQA